MDLLNFDKDIVIVMDGACLIDVPLSSILASHKMNNSAITAIVRELDLS